MGSFGYLADVLLFSLILITLVSTLLESKHFMFILESGIAILIGIASEAFLENSLHSAIALGDKYFFFFVMLPIVIFAQGYMIKKGQFFKYSFQIFLFGFIGTILTFFMIYGLNYVFNRNGGIVESNTGAVLHFTTYQLFIFSACMISSEPMVAKVFADPNIYPKQFNLLYGEETLNDVVAFTFVFGAITLLPVHATKADFHWYIYFEFAGLFILEIGCAVIVGIIFAFMITLITKHCRFILHEDFITAAFIIYSGYLSFTFGKSLNLVGVISTLVTGVIASHYMVYNISLEAQHLTVGACKTLQYIAESLISFYIGCLTFKIFDDNHKISWNLVFYEIGILFFTRFITFFLLAFLVKLTRLGRTFYLNYYELLFLCWAGQIKGFVVYALIEYIHFEEADQGDESLDEQQIEQVGDTSGYNQPVIKSTALLVIVLSTFIYGGLLWPISKLCKSHTETIQEEEERHEKEKVLRRAKTQRQQQEVTLKPTHNQTYKQWFAIIDEKILKEFLIYDYQNRKHQLKKLKSQYKQHHKAKQDSHSHQNHEETHDNDNERSRDKSFELSLDSISSVEKVIPIGDLELAEKQRNNSESSANQPEQKIH